MSAEKRSGERFGIIISCVCLLLLTLLVSCSKVLPAGFWQHYHTDLLLSKIADHGPYGGTTAIYWKGKPHSFSRGDIIGFANGNGWRLADSIFLTVDSLDKITGGDSTFPFIYSDQLDLTHTDPHFRRLIRSDVILYRFTTGWVAIKSGNARQTNKNGYALVNYDGSELAVYHLWGE